MYRLDPKIRAAAPGQNLCSMGRSKRTPPYRPHPRRRNTAHRALRRQPGIQIHPGPARRPHPKSHRAPLRSHPHLVQQNPPNHRGQRTTHVQPADPKTNLRPLPRPDPPPPPSHPSLKYRDPRPRTRRQYPPPKNRYQIPNPVHPILRTRRPAASAIH